MTLNNFIKIWLIIFILCMSFVALLNIFIDPYGLWNTPRIDSLNKLKPASGTRSRLVKPHQLRNFNANTLILVCRSAQFYRACLDLFYSKQAPSFHPIAGDI